MQAYDRSTYIDSKTSRGAMMDHIFHIGNIRIGIVLIRDHLDGYTFCIDFWNARHATFEQDEQEVQ